MAYSSILGGERAPSQPNGKTAGLLGPSDSSDSGSDAMGELGPDQLDSDSDRHGTGERASADASDDGRSADILPDQVSLLDGDERSPGAIRAGELSDLDALDDEADPDAEA